MTGYSRTNKQIAAEKFMQSLSTQTKKELDEIAHERGISIQELIRAVVVPEWLRYLRNIDIKIEATVIAMRRKLPFENFQPPSPVAAAEQH